MTLSDRTIREEIEGGRIIIKPFDSTCVQPASVDIHLDSSIRVFRPWVFPHMIDLRQPLDGLTEPVKIDQDHNFALQPGQFVLGSTLEYIAIPNDLMARLEGKSSLGRIGLLIHSTAGYVDPGWRGHLTLELYNVSPLPILLYPGMKISQLSFHLLTTAVERPYGSPGLGSKYQGQVGPTPTRFYQEFSQPTLLPEAFVPRLTTTRRLRQARARNSVLGKWLQESEFRGSIRRFAEVLEVPLKTAEGWFYRGSHPSSRYRPRLYFQTGLQQYYSKEAGGQPSRLKGLD